MSNASRRMVQSPDVGGFREMCCGVSCVDNELRLAHNIRIIYTGVIGQNHLLHTHSFGEI
ncbi:MAG: hypothetical protein NVS3B14_08830 [Ktedonobacteraceae bacterium]